MTGLTRAAYFNL